MKLKKLLDLAPTITELKPDITLYSDDGPWCMEINRVNYTKWDFSMFYVLYKDPEEPLVFAEDVDDYKAELERLGFSLDSEWHIAENEVKELEDVVASANMAFQELMEDLK